MESNASPSHGANTFDQQYDNTIKFRAADGGSIDLGDGENYNDDDDTENSNSEEERGAYYGNDASNNLSYTKMKRKRDQMHIREKVIDE